MCSSGQWRASRTPRSISSRYKAPRPESTARFLDPWHKLIGKMIRRTAWVNLRVKGVMGQNCPPTAGLASRDGCQGQARARERGLNRHQGPRSGDSNDRTVRRLRTWRHYTTGSEPVKPVACFSGFRGRARPDQGSAGILPRTRWFHPPSWAAGAFGRSAQNISSFKCQIVYSDCNLPKAYPLFFIFS